MAFKGKVAFEFDPFKQTGVKVPKGRQAEAKEAVAEYVKTEVLKHVGSGKSPVEGGPWKKGLSKSYKSEKAKVSSAGFSNLELHGHLLDSLNVKPKSGGKLSLEVSPRQAPKADGNNRGTYGTKTPDDGKARRFIPLDGEDLKKTIWRGVKDILSEYEED